jgi:hypothetical protein
MCSGKCEAWPDVDSPMPLSRVMRKISSSEQEFSAIDRERMELAKQIEELQRKQEGLTLQADDIKADLTR